MELVSDISAGTSGEDENEDPEHEGDDRVHGVDNLVFFFGSAIAVSIDSCVFAKRRHAVSKCSVGREFLAENAPPISLTERCLIIIFIRRVGVDNDRESPVNNLVNGRNNKEDTEGRHALLASVEGSCTQIKPQTCHDLAQGT